jgi:Na+/H+-translocating membrane pyrophosphatase
LKAENLDKARAQREPSPCRYSNGDTVGDPMKEAAGPGQNIFTKLMSVTALMFAPLTIKYFLHI